MNISTNTSVAAT